MNNALKALAIAGLAGSISASAFAAAHLDMATMTCAQFKDLSAEDKLKVATMAVAEVDDGANGAAAAGTPKATESSVGDTTAAASTNEDSEMENAPELLDTICDRNLDALVSEAAIGMAGTR